MPDEPDEPGHETSETVETEAGYRADDLASFLQRSYLAVDGLWFVKAEEALGYDAALRLDEEVWRIMPKIQARRARDILGISEATLKALCRALGLKLAAEGNSFQACLDGGADLDIRVSRCAWLDAIRSSGRESIAPDICRRICAPEMAIWANEFSANIRFECRGKMGAGDTCCHLHFHKKEPAV